MTSEPRHSDREERTQTQSPGDRDADAMAERSQREREIQQWAERVVDAMPPLTPEQRERLALLLRTTR
ncbi:hypothetical protein [Nocardiopsis salina]|uniref:hypothetical protein n=1 Tax=Nocardiopsis salina TaxID=245836 RepID=UPI00034C5A44|nr:hypothetical protein [Nocardiopsis salina]